MISLEDFWHELTNSGLRNSKYWKQKIHDVNCKIHIALMVEPYLSLILCGQKTIESRFSKKKIIPFNKVSSGDIVILKKSGGDLVAIFEVEFVRFIQISGINDFKEIKEKYGKELCLDNEFWERKKDAKYVTLIKICHLYAISPIMIKKPNRQSWITYDKEKVIMKENNEAEKVVCIVGKIASGKTTIAKELAFLLNGKQFSISDYLKSCLRKKGIEEPSRSQLQELGEKFIANGWENFCEDFFEYVNYDSNKTYIIDGIRHKDFFYSLCNKLYPVNPILVYLNVDEEILENRKKVRQEVEYNEERLAEGNLLELKIASDFIINTYDKSVEEIVNEILEKIEKKNIEKKIEDSRVVIQDLKRIINCFNMKRKWNSYHNIQNLAMSICIEAAELLEIFQWSDQKEADKNARRLQSEHMKEELADIIIYCINLANAYDIDISSCIVHKLQKNAKKYPPK